VGVTDTQTIGLIKTDAEALFVLSATLVTRTCTTVGDATLVGATYRPSADTVPTAGDKLHTTPVLDVPVRLARNCARPPS
jgi:hypothetical protein